MNTRDLIAGGVLITGLALCGYVLVRPELAHDAPPPSSQQAAAAPTLEQQERSGERFPLGYVGSAKP